MEMQTGRDIFTARNSQLISDCSLKTSDRQKAKVEGNVYRRIHMMKREREINYTANKADLCPTSKASHCVKLQLTAMKSRKLVPYIGEKKNICQPLQKFTSQNWPHKLIRRKLNPLNRVATNSIQEEKYSSAPLFSQASPQHYKTSCQERNNPCRDPTILYQDISNSRCMCTLQGEYSCSLLDTDLGGVSPQVDFSKFYRQQLS